MRVDFAPGAVAPEHSHPGEEIAYVNEGLLEYRFEGKPPVTLKAGEALLIPAGAIHSAKNVGGGNAAEVVGDALPRRGPRVLGERGDRHLPQA